MVDVEIMKAAQFLDGLTLDMHTKTILLHTETLFDLRERVEKLESSMDHARMYIYNLNAMAMTLNVARHRELSETIRLYTNLKLPVPGTLEQEFELLEKTAEMIREPKTF